MSSTVEKPHASAESLKLDMSQLERLTSLASSKNCAPDFLVQEAIERYLRAEEAQQTLMKSVDDSVAHFEATGLHITLDEFMAWTKAVQSNRDATPPACHV
jgi:predicted transcriptional regulator